MIPVRIVATWSASSPHGAEVPDCVSWADAAWMPNAPTTVWAGAIDAISADALAMCLDVKTTSLSLAFYNASVLNCETEPRARIHIHDNAVAQQLNYAVGRVIKLDEALRVLDFAPRNAGDDQALNDACDAVAEATRSYRYFQFAQAASMLTRYVDPMQSCIDIAGMKF